MSPPRPPDSRRAEALALLEQFAAQLLPGVLRRIAVWKGIPPKQLAELRDDVLQELRVECLLRADELLSMDARGRHARWMRLTERTVYRLGRHARRCTPLDDQHVAADATDGSVAVQLPKLITLHNGRANVAESARAAGLGRRAMRERLDRLAADLGWDDDRRRFWEARAAEALTGLAADLLRAQNATTELDTPPAPDLDARRARLRRLARRFPVQPSTLVARRALQPWIRRPRPDPAPRTLLEHATALAPDRATGWLWLFEALDGAAARAAAALRRASRCADLERAGLVLARARLLQRRGQHARALGVLARARARRDPDGRLQRAWARVSS